MVSLRNLKENGKFKPIVLLNFILILIVIVSTIISTMMPLFFINVASFLIALMIINSGSVDG